MKEGDHPFKVGQFVEAKSFLPGYRGAWFRCKVSKIREIDLRNKFPGIALQYYDFPDEKIRWTRLYQKSRRNDTIRKSNRYDTKRNLMVRPCFPCIYHECELPDINSISEVVIIVNDAWKVGDMVDWWADGCYWAGRLTEKLGEEKFKVELWPPPDGEGLSYEASCKDFRPSLNWSAEGGWTVPIPESGGSCHPCARLIHPMKQVHGVDGHGKYDQVTTGAVQEHKASHSSQILGIFQPPPGGREQLVKEPSRTTLSSETRAPEHTVNINGTHGDICKASCSDGISSLHVKDASRDIERNADAKDDSCDDAPSKKKMRSDKGILLNSMHSEAMEAAVLDLEELVNRVKWIKNILEFGMPSSNSARPSWKFVQHRGGPSIP